MSSDFARVSPFSKSHVFDGKNLHRSEATFQLVDITDKQLYGLIREPAARKATIDVSVHDHSSL